MIFLVGGAVIVSIFVAIILCEIEKRSNSQKPRATSALATLAQYKECSSEAQTIWVSSQDRILSTEVTSISCKKNSNIHECTLFKGRAQLFTVITREPVIMRYDHVHLTQNISEEEALSYKCGINTHRFMNDRDLQLIVNEFKNLIRKYEESVKFL